MTEKENRVLAGMRVWPDSLHLGTFYGWIKPLKELALHQNISVVIADLQSIENFSSETDLREATTKLEAELCGFLPDAEVSVESKLEGFDLYSVQAASLFCNRFFKRLGPFKDFCLGKETTFLKTLYPSMMVADVLILQPNMVLAKSGESSPHIDVVNDVLQKGASCFSWPRLHVCVLGKSPVYIPNTSGSAPMRRSDAKKAVTVRFGMSSDELFSQFRRNNVCLPQDKDFNLCKVIAPTWRAISRDITDNISPCITHKDCWRCVNALCERIAFDVSPS